MGVESKEFRFITRELDGAGGLGGGVRRICRRQFIGDHDRLGGIKVRVSELLQGCLIVGVDLPLGEQFDARQRAGEFEEGEPAFGIGHGGELFPPGHFGHAGPGSDIESGMNTEAALDRVNLGIQQFQEAGHAQHVAGIGQLPEPGDGKQVGLTGGEERPHVAQVKFRRARQLNDVERLNPVILEMVLKPFSVVERLKVRPVLVDKILAR